MSTSIEQLFSLSGKTAVVTGGAKGLGAMISAALAAAGARVIVISRTPAQPQQIGAGLHSGNCTCLAADLTDPASLRAAAAEVRRLAPALSILVNNAGVFNASELAAVTPERWDADLAINLRAPFFMIQELLPQLKAAAQPGDPARVVNIGSISALWSKSLGAYAYGCAKIALHHLTRMLAAELSASGVHVNAIAPGFFPTDMTAGFFAANPGAKEAAIASIPARRMGEASDIGGMVVALCARSGAYLSGAVLPLEGGLASA